MTTTANPNDETFFEALENAGALYEHYLETAQVATIPTVSEQVGLPSAPGAPLTLQIQTQ